MKRNIAGSRRRSVPPDIGSSTRCRRPAASLVNPCLEPKTAQPVQHIKTGKPRADYHGIEGSGFRLARLGIADGGHVAFLPLNSVLVAFLWT